MTRRRFLVPPERIRNAVASLQPDQAHHLRHVLRLEPGSEVELFDGRGNGYRGTVEFHGPDVQIVALRRIDVPREAPFHLTLAPALLKLDKFELVLQKGTELGVDEFVPLLSRFCQSRIPESRIDQRMKRWERIIQEASKQCRRFSVPTIRRPVEFEKFLSESSSSCARFLLYENAKIYWPAGVLVSERTLLCVGPEGGWDVAEVREAEEAGWTIFRIGGRILRAETAAIAAVTLFRFGAAACAGIDKR
jgi:16S rRNA (uracil1498-N3)-methyltransferase